MSGAEFAIERLADKATRIALARAETLLRDHRRERADAPWLRAPSAHDN